MTSLGGWFGGGEEAQQGYNGKAYLGNPNKFLKKVIKLSKETKQSLSEESKQVYKSRIFSKQSLFKVVNAFI